MSYPMPDFSIMKGQELVDCYNLYSSKPRQGKFHDNEQGRRVCEDLWRKWAAKNPPRSMEAMQLPTAAYPDHNDAAHAPPEPISTVEQDIESRADHEVAHSVFAAKPQEWDIGTTVAKYELDSPAVKPVTAHVSDKASTVEQTVSKNFPRPGSKAGRLTQELRSSHGLTLSKGVELTGWATPSIVRAELTRIAHGIGKVITCEKREGKESVFRMEG